MTFDLILKGGVVVDGTRKAPYPANICIADGKIALITTQGAEAAETLDISGKVIAPGFIDIHTHSDASPLVNYTVESKIAQGVTTEITGNCGISCLPATPEHLDEINEYFSSQLELPLGGLKPARLSVTDYAADVKAHGASINYGVLVGHGTLRLAVMGFVKTGVYQGLPRVRLTGPVYDNVDDVINCTGTVKAASYGVFPENASMVTNVFASVGDRVRSGQRLASVDVNDYAVSASAPVLPNAEALLDAIRQGGASGLNLSGLETLLPSLQAQDYVSVITKNSVITAPASGVITQINALKDNYVSALVPMFVVTDLSDMTLEVKVSENKIHQIEKGQYVRISGSGFDGRSYDGYVETISPVAKTDLLNQDTAYVSVTIRILEPDDKIVPGFTANGAIYIATREHVKKLALECILQDETGQEYVFVYEDGSVMRRDVTCSYTSSDYVEVIGIEPDELVVYAPEGNLKDGQSVLLEEDWRVW